MKSIALFLLLAASVFGQNPPNQLDGAGTNGRLPISAGCLSAKDGSAPQTIRACSDSIVFGAVGEVQGVYHKNIIGADEGGTPLCVDTNADGAEYKCPPGGGTLPSGAQIVDSLGYTPAVSVPVYDVGDSTYTQTECTATYRAVGYTNPHYFVTKNPADCPTGSTLTIEAVSGISLTNEIFVMAYDYTATFADMVTLGEKLVFYSNPASGRWQIVSPTSGAFTATLNGTAGPLTETITYSRSGDQVTLFIPVQSGTSATANTTFTVTGMLASIYPAHGGAAPIPPNVILNNSVQMLNGDLYIDTDGTIKPEIIVSGAVSQTYSALGNKGFQYAFHVTYTVAN